MKEMTRICYADCTLTFEEGATVGWTWVLRDCGSLIRCYSNMAEAVIGFMKYSGAEVEDLSAEGFAEPEPDPLKKWINQNISITD